MRIPGGISSLNDNAMAENSRLAPLVGLNPCFLKPRDTDIVLCFCKKQSTFYLIMLLDSSPYPR